MTPLLIGWVLLGLFIGLTAKVLNPSPEDVGWVVASLLGVLGAVCGGALAYWAGFGATADQIGGWLLALICAIALLNLGQRFRRREPVP